MYPGLDHDEAVEVMTELKNRGVSYKEDNGTIYVPSDQENALRMDLSNEGHPKTAPNYDFFTNHVNAMTTDDERRIIEKYQLQQRLEAVIKTLDPVDTDYVTITLPEKSGYVVNTTDDRGTASVTVKVKEGKTLNANQVYGIKQLVSKSVPNLSADDVSVIDDTSGEELSASSDDARTSGSQQIDLTEFKLKIEQQYENEIESKIVKLLTGSFGNGNVSASVKSQMDLDKKIEDIITYQPASSGGKTGIISEENTQHETTTPASSKGGVAGTQNNANGGTTTYPGVTMQGNSIVTKDNASYKYLVSQVEEQIQSDAGALQDLTVSVIINNQNGAITPTQQQDLTDAIANAAGVKPQKVKLIVNSAPVSAKPANTAPSNPPLNKILLIAGGSAILLGIILAVLLILKKRKKRAEEVAERLGQSGEVNYEGLGQEPPVPEESSVEEIPAVGAEQPEKEEEKEVPPKESIEDIRNSNNSKEEQVKEDLQEFATKNPEIAAQLIRSWLKGEDDHG